MNIFERISQIDRKFAWSFLGVLIAIFSLWNFRDNPGTIQIELTSKARVYDVHADVPGLAIQFEGENIREKKQVLSFFTVRLSNPGGKPVTQDMYDKNLVFGLQLSSGRAFPPELVEASQQYLRENIQPALSSPTNIEFRKVVFDPGAHFTIRFLILHLESTEPALVPLGKIAGATFDGMPIVLPEAKAKRSFWKDVISGSPGVHAVRFLAYIMLMIALGVGIGAPLAAFDSWRTNRRSKKTADKFRAYQGTRDATHADILARIATLYGDKGLTFIARVGELKSTKRSLARLLHMAEAYDHRPMHTEDPFFFVRSVLMTLMDADVLEERNGVLTPKASLQDNIQDFRAFWRATEPTDTNATSRFVDRAIGRLKNDAQQTVGGDSETRATDGADSEAPQPFDK